MSSNLTTKLVAPSSRPGVPGRTRAFRALLAGAAAALAVAAHVRAADLQVVASGLNNPRGLDFAPNGALFIAEAGTGGSGPIVQGPEGPVQFGLTGSITRLFKGVQVRIVTGLPSVAHADGSTAIGPSSVFFGQLGHAFVTIGLGMDPAVRDSELGAQAAAMATVMQMSQNGQMKLVADLGAFELAEDPDGLGPDSNPNGVTSDRGGAIYVADAGANALLHVSARGAVSVVAVFPNRMVPTPPFLPPGLMPMQAVPTNVAIGPDGALYVSELTGFPFPAGEARIYRVVPGSAPTIYAQGFTNIIDLEFDAQGNLYVLEIDANGLLAPSPTGRLARVNAGSGTVDTIITEGLVMPGGMTIGPDGVIYITNFSTSPGGGQVVRLQP